MVTRENEQSGKMVRVGVIVPQSNTTNEIEFNRLARPGLSFHFARIPLHTDLSHKNHLDSLSEDLEIAATHLGSCDCDLVVFGCTSDSMAFGDNALLPVISSAAGAPALTTATAITSTLADLNITRIAMASPYTEETNRKEAAFLEGAGFKVVSAAGLSLNTSFEQIKKMSRVTADEVYQLALSVNQDDAEALLICCTDFNTLDVIEPLERELGKPVVTSNTATYSLVMKRLPFPGKRTGYGRILSDLPGQ
jgi:maleate cis-trans isomerase